MSALEQRRCDRCLHSRPGYGSLLCAAGDRKPIDTIFARDIGGLCGPDGNRFEPRPMTDGRRRHDHDAQ